MANPAAIEYFLKFVAAWYSIMTSFLCILNYSGDQSQFSLLNLLRSQKSSSTFIALNWSIIAIMVLVYISLVSEWQKDMKRDLPNASNVRKRN